MTDFTIKQLAEYVRATFQTREASYRPLPEHGTYTLCYREAAKLAGVPEELQLPVCCLLTSAYTDVHDWCDAILKTEAEAEAVTA